MWLEREQQRDGSWAGPSPQARLTSTAQTLRAFTAAGFPSTYGVLANSIKWLCQSDNAAQLNHHFWRLAALSEHAEVPENLLEHDLRALQTALDGGVQIDPRLNYRAYLIECALNLKKPPEWLQKHVAEAKARLTARSVEVTPDVWGYVALERLDPTLEPAFNTAVVAGMLQKQTSGYHLNGSIIETAYFVLNCSRSPHLSVDAALGPVVDGAVTWLLSKQNTKGGGWAAERPPYSGDPQGSAYFTAVVVRALAAYLGRYRPTKLAEVAIPDWILRRRTITLLRRIGVLALVSLALVTFGLLVPLTWGKLAAAIGVIGSLAGIVAFFWEAQKKLGGR